MGEALTDGVPACLIGSLGGGHGAGRGVSWRGRVVARRWVRGGSARLDAAPAGAGGQPHVGGQGRLGPAPVLRCQAVWPRLYVMRLVSPAGARVHPGATHEMGWRDFDGLTGVSVLPLTTKGEWQCRSRNWSSIFQHSRIRVARARSSIG